MRYLNISGDFKSSCDFNCNMICLQTLRNKEKSMSTLSGKYQMGGETNKISENGSRKRHIVTGN